MDIRLLAHLALAQSLLTSGVTAMCLGRGLAGLVLVGLGAALAAPLLPRVLAGGGAGAPAAAPGVDPRAATPVEPKVLVHGQGLHRRGPPSTSEAAVGEATEAKTFVPDYSAQAMPGLADIYREIQSGAIHGYLLVVAGPNRAKGVALREGEIRIGRGLDATFQLTDGRASNQQCTVVYRDGAAYVIDAGSRNGTYVNNERIQKDTRLGNCDVIAFGGTKILVALPMDDAAGVGPDDATTERPIAGV